MVKGTKATSLVRSRSFQVQRQLGCAAITGFSPETPVLLEQVNESEGASFTIRRSSIRLLSLTYVFYFLNDVMNFTFRCKQALRASTRRSRTRAKQERSIDSSVFTVNHI